MIYNAFKGKKPSNKQKHLMKNYYFSYKHPIVSIFDFQMPV